MKKLSELHPEVEGDCFALLQTREQATTRAGKPYYRVKFRDAERSVTVMIWGDSAWFSQCDSAWSEGGFYKLRCTLQESAYGLQIEIDQIRSVEDGDEADGFDPADFFIASRFDREEMFGELQQIAENEISPELLRTLVFNIMNTHAEEIKVFPAASRNHHAFTGGYIEHVLSVTKTACYLADKYREYYTNMQPPLSKSLVVAGAILHDIGKLVELDYRPEKTNYSAAGQLVGHILLGRDIVREQAALIPEFPEETLLRLEHIIISHQNLPEWGSPIAPHTPEALLVHYADDIDAKFQMMANALEIPPADDEQFTGRDNPLRRSIFRGLQLPDQS